MKKRVLVTAGSTAVMIDKVRCITNIFKGRTGNTIAHYLQKTGKYEVDLITSNNEMVPPPSTHQTFKYKTYDELYNTMESLMTTWQYDVIIHSAAVSDYKVERVNSDMVNACDTKVSSEGKISSSHDALWIKMVPTRKIVDDIRTLWGQTGKLVKFKLQVDMSDNELVRVAAASMKHSKADIIVANCLEWCNERAYIIQDRENDGYGVTNIQRVYLAKELEELL